MFFQKKCYNKWFYESVFFTEEIVVELKRLTMRNEDFAGGSIGLWVLLWLMILLLT